MDCRIIDNKVIIRDGSAVSVPPKNFDDTDRIESYYGIVLKLNQVSRLEYSGWMISQSQLKT